MRINVTENNVIIAEKSQINTGEINAKTIEFNFDEAYENLIKHVLFTKDDNTIEIILDSNTCNIPEELTKKTGSVSLGVYAENNEKTIRYSPTPTTFNIVQGSYEENVIALDGYLSILPSPVPAMFVQYNEVSQGSYRKYTWCKRIENGEPVYMTTSEIENFLRNVKITNAAKMFYYAEHLIDGPELDLSEATDVSEMYYSCTSLETVPEMDLKQATSTKELFYYCPALSEIEGLLNTSNVENMSRMFYYCDNITEIPDFDSSKATDMSYMFCGCSSLTRFPQLDTTNVVNCNQMFSDCSKLTNNNLPELNLENAENIDYMFAGTKLTEIPYMYIPKVTSLKGTFNAIRTFTSIDMSNIDLSNITDMSYSFYGVNLPNTIIINCLNATNFQRAFGGTSNYGQKDMINVNTSKGENMSEMFYDAQELGSVINLNTASAKNMYRMFYKCYKLTAGPQMDTSHVTNFKEMFYMCERLASIPQYNASSATDMTDMFSSGPEDHYHYSSEFYNNILGMCATAASYPKTKTLRHIGIFVAESTVSSLSNYADFLAAGWRVS